jgi:hypothetical protein
MAFSALGWVALREPLAMSAEVAGCLLIGLAGLGIASPAICAVLRAARPAAAAAGNGGKSPTAGAVADGGDSESFQTAFGRLIDQLGPVS